MDTWSRELREYASRAESSAFRKQVAAQLADDAHWGLERVRTPTKLAFGTSRERLVTFLMGCEVLGSDPDSGAYVAIAKLRKQLAAGASVIANEWKKRGRGSFEPLR